MWNDVKFMKKCPSCGSIWVCWNWMHFTKESMNEFLIETGADYRHETDLWGHECWDCENAIETNEKVKNGIPYWILKYFHKFFSEV